MKEQILEVDKPKGVYDELYEKLMKKTAKEVVRMLDKRIKEFEKIKKERGE